MRYSNDFEVDFEYNGARYTAHADCVVELSKRDVGPLQGRDHAERYTAFSVETNTLRVWEGSNPDWLETIPSDVKFVAERELGVIASEFAEEFHNLER
jgi:hypothetical protein